MGNIQIALKLEVQAGNKIMVPGREPLSDATSPKLLAAQPPGPAMVDVQLVLQAIPGSYLEYGDNWVGNTGRRRAWLVLPPRDQTCPCAPQPDWYKVIGELPGEEPPVEEHYRWCDVLGQGFCPSPGFGEEPAPRPNPNRPEGGTPYGATGVLPILPPWSRS